MLIRVIVIFAIFFYCCHNTPAVCPVSTVQSAKNIKEQIEKQLSPAMDYVFFSQTPTGFVISVNSDLIFDKSGNITMTGKLFLVQMAQIIKNSGHKWQIFTHSRNLPTQIEQISETTEQAIKITNYLTDTESCLLNQIIPIGFGSIMPVKNPTQLQSQNRVDFIVEEFKFSR